MSNDNAALKDRFVAAVFAGDHDTLRALAHEEFELWQNPALPYGQVYKGADGFLAFLDAFMATYEIETLDNTRNFASPDGGVVCEFVFKGKVVASQKAFDTKLIEVWDFRDGKVLRVVTYWFETPFAAAA